jgi:hypothetical protein
LRFRERSIKSVTDLLKALAVHKPVDQAVWFRGQVKIDWELKPSLMRRTGGLAREQALAKRFRQNALLLLPQRPQTEWEWLFIMQHHGVPTRLLDWTESPLVALYFAVNEQPKSDGAFWALLPMELNKLANAPTPVGDLPAFDADEFLENYLPSTLAKEKQSELKTVASIAPRNTPRSQAQLSVFTISHRDITAIEDLGDEQHVWRYLVPANSKKTITQELTSLHITELTLFPELPNVGKYAREILR